MITLTLTLTDGNTNRSAARSYPLEPILKLPQRTAGDGYIAIVRLLQNEITQPIETTQAKAEPQTAAETVPQPKPKRKGTQARD